VDNCFAGAEDHKSTWLATVPDLPTENWGDEYPRGKLKVNSGRRDELLQYISRCVVCETIFKLVVVHSMKNEVPECPEGYIGAKSPNRFIPTQDPRASKWWVGYSYWSVSMDNYAIGSNVAQPASCLLYYSPFAVAECDVEGCKLQSNGQKSMWLMDAKKKPEAGQDRQSFRNAHSYTSRCRVCHRPEAGKIEFKDLYI